MCLPQDDSGGRTVCSVREREDLVLAGFLAQRRHEPNQKGLAAVSSHGAAVNIRAKTKTELIDNPGLCILMHTTS